MDPSSKGHLLLGFLQKITKEEPDVPRFNHMLLSQASAVAREARGAALLLATPVSHGHCRGNMQRALPKSHRMISSRKEHLCYQRKEGVLRNQKQ